jgi:SAM-dependent methyltransferase
VPAQNYAESFGYQWRRFQSTQLDTVSGVPLSEERFFAETGWTPEWLNDKIVLDVGCGAGRFAEVASRHARLVVGMDYSSAVDAAHENLLNRPNVHIVQADIFNLPFRSKAVDGLYCLGVLQHTPAPVSAARELPWVIKDGGRLAITVYERRRYTKLGTKYLLRRGLRRLDPEQMLKLVQWSMPVLFPISEILFRVPVLNRIFRYFLPVANYVDEPRLGLRQRYTWAVLDTLDALSPSYDNPLTEAELRVALQTGGAGSIERLPNPALNLVATMPS